MRETDMAGERRNSKGAMLALMHACVCACIEPYVRVIQWEIFNILKYFSTRKVESVPITHIGHTQVREVDLADRLFSCNSNSNAGRSKLLLPSDCCPWPLKNKQKSCRTTSSGKHSWYIIKPGLQCNKLVKSQTYLLYSNFYSSIHGRPQPPMWPERAFDMPRWIPTYSPSETGERGE